MAWDVEGTKRKLLDAATAEFSAFGLAGARVDRIASTAGVNKERIYEYFGKKDELFAAVLLDQLTLAADTVPIRGTGIDAVLDYVGRLFDHHVRSPELSRLTAWEGLELGRAVGAEVRTAHVERKLGAFRAALPELPEAAARELQLSIVVLVCGWQSMPNVDGLYRDATSSPTARIAARRVETVASVEARLREALAHEA
jgi:AcrR family transcriptional regulator